MSDDEICVNLNNNQSSEVVPRKQHTGRKEIWFTPTQRLNKGKTCAVAIADLRTLSHTLTKPEPVKVHAKCQLVY